MTSDLASLLFGSTRREALAQLLLHPGASLHVRGLARLTGKAPGTLLRELNQLADAGILKRHSMGNQVHFQANESCPIHDELRGIIKKTAGIADVLRDALEPIQPRVTLSFVYGSIARGDERAGSDLDLMVVGSAGFGEVVHALQAAQNVLRREINPNVMRVAVFRKRLSVGEPYLTRVMEDRKIFVMGGPDDLGKLAPDRKAEAAPRRKG